MRLTNDDLVFIADALNTKKDEAEAGLISAAESMDLDAIRANSEVLAGYETLMQKINKRLNPAPKAVETPDATVEDTDQTDTQQVA